MSGRLLVTGFGAFPGVSSNPTAALALAVDGARVRGRTVRGVVLPVTWDGVPAGLGELLATEQCAGGPVALVGLGVAPAPPSEGRVAAVQVRVERRGVRAAPPPRPLEGRPDAAGVLQPSWGEGPDEVVSRVDVDGLARALGGRVSESAGAYVCNWWAWVAGVRWPEVASVFVHVSGPIPARRLLRGLDFLAAGAEST